MLLDCPGCKKTNRVDPKKKSRCGQCKRDFTPRDLVKARPEPRPDFDLDEEEEEQCDQCGRLLNDDGECPKCD